MQRYVVLRPLPVGGGTLPSGTIVDVTGWRNTARLVSQRYLRVATVDDLAGDGQPPAPRQRGRAVHAATE